MPIIASIILCAIAADPPLVLVDRDNIEITQSCRVRVAQSPIIDADSNGVVHITAGDITVDFSDDSPPLLGANADQLPDSFAGTGIVIAGHGVKLNGAKVSGFKVGMHAIRADGLIIHHCDVSNNFHQRLKSTPRAEDASDWLWPQANDNNEWITNYGAGMCVEDSSNVTLHDIRARKTQNGIILDAVNDSKVYDCDCSFLSGWGLAMWRSNRNVISRNAFDFCVRGYSHGVYNRGQDSAGILMFEQCCDNIIAENSATHCGDGLFGFAGKEALGEVNPREDIQWYRRRGNNDNLIVGNDLSYAPAHGLEITFSFGNTISGNRFDGNAICGIWGGYSQATVIAGNQFSNNGSMGYGSERGGVNIEHGMHNRIIGNAFERNACGVRLWWDDDTALMSTPWARANQTASSNNEVRGNTFTSEAIAIELRQTADTTHSNAYVDVNTPLNADDASRRSAFDAREAPGVPAALDAVAFRMGDDWQPPGQSHPHGARASLSRRENIIMTEWGPYDWAEPLAVADGSIKDEEGNEWAQVRVMNPPDDGYSVTCINHQGLTSTSTVPPGGNSSGESRFGPMLHAHSFQGSVHIHRLRADEPGFYSIAVTLDAQFGPAVSRIVVADWAVKFFASSVDPRTDVSAWRTAGEQSHPQRHTSLDMAFGGSGPEVTTTEGNAQITRQLNDHFGIIATAPVHPPPGRWRITTTSDDGIRVWLDDELVIDDWTWHAPKKHTFDFDVAEPREVKMRVEYFELDGFAVLQLDISPAPQ